MPSIAQERPADALLSDSIGFRLLDEKGQPTELPGGDGGYERNASIHPAIPITDRLLANDPPAVQSTKERRAYDKLIFRKYITDEAPYRWVSRNVDAVATFEKIDAVLREIEFHKVTNPGDVTVGSKDIIVIEFHKQEKLRARLEQIGSSFCSFDVYEDGLKRPIGTYLATLREEERQRLRSFVEGLR